ncbi:MAG: hypothetical protein GX877_04880 [Bacteroidales bacterium]|nr:hypothetical protein [Bacteroidales bacterium]
MKKRIYKEDWVECKLGEIAKWSSGGTPKSTNKSYYNGNIPWLIIRDLNDGSVFNSEKKITQKGLENSSAKIVKPDSVLVAMYGSIGKLGINKVEVTTNQAIAFTQTQYSGIYNKYLFHYLYYSRPLLHSLGKGATQKNISQTILKIFPFPLPPFPIQHAIVKKIEEHFSSLDNGIDELKKAHKKLKIYRQAVLKKAFEGELTKEWRSNNNLDSWSDETFESITNSLKRGPFGGDLKKAFFVENGYPVYEQQHAINNTFNNLRYFINEERYNLLKACEALPGDYIVSCSGTMGRIARIPKDAKKGIINQALMRIRINEEKISHKYFIKFFKSQMFQSKILQDSRGSGMQNMAGIRELKPIKISLPPRPEQHQIVKEIELHLSVYDAVEKSIKESLLKAELLRQSILKRAFEGKLLTPEEIEQCKQHPDYEPASVLLEKIKTEKKNQNR